ncbi:C2 domain-containing protein [Melia azedarach]|uniref:C2 domain-containing protein n=1 Tax=Melia azedarach TaxID=155640 RepID=A0ACC1YE62_MELAZ|nr:C2 domain-containing protein [Melia azedarach]
MAAARKLMVEVVDARNLSPKDGHGSSSPYVVIDYYGQRRKTRTAIGDLNPTWNEGLEFNVAKPSEVFTDMLELDVLHDRKYGPTRRNNFLGRIRLSSSQFVKKGEEALIYYPLEKKSLFSWITGEIGLKIYYIDVVPVPPAPAPVPQPDPPAEEVKPDPPAEQVQPEAKPETPPNAEAEVPPPAEQQAEGKKPSEEAAAEAKAEAPPAQSPAPKPVPAQENVAPEGDKDPECGSSAATEPTQGQDGNQAEAQTTEQKVPPPAAMQEQSDHIEFDFSTPKMTPPPSPAVHVMEATVTGSVPEVKVTPIHCPQPISRTVSMASYASDHSDNIAMEKSSFDLVEKMHYLFVRVVKARGLPTNGSPVVKIAIGNNHVESKPARKTTCFEWDQTFAFGRDSPDSSSFLEVAVCNPPRGDVAAAAVFLGGICFDVTEIPLRDPPDSPLAPQWYRLEGGGIYGGDLMLATWVGTQADEAFADAWKTDTAGHINSKAKVYVSPKLWYLRATVIEAQDILPQLAALKEASFTIKAQLGFQVQKTKVSVTRNGSPSWNEDLLFVAAEPFTDHLIFNLENRQPKGTVTLGVTRVPLTAIERRVDDRKVTSRWFTFEHINDEKRLYKGRVHLRLCFDGGYHVMDEAAHVCSDYRPTARQLWKPPVGTVELGVIGCKNLLPMKTVNGKGTTDAYVVAKYASKWIRTRTVSDSLEPRWNEQYTWKVYDPCTVLTIGVFDSWGIFEADNPSKETTRPDCRIGKVRIRISTLETGKVYRNTYPLLLLGNNGTTKLGDIELAVRFIRLSPTLDFLHVYSQPLLPLMHHIKPLGVAQQEMLRSTSVKIIAAHLARSEPPVRREVVLYMLDVDTHAFSMRKVRANWFRIINVLAGVLDIVRWVEDTRAWKNPTATILVHALLVMLVWFPDLIVPTIAFYVFVIGAWNYRFRSRDLLPHFDPKISMADAVERDELDEEFDTVPSGRPQEVVRVRYDKLRTLGARVQTVLGDFAAQGERVQALVTWRDPRATGIFVLLCFVVAMILYLVPSKMVAMAFGFYYLRHPMFRDRMPSPAVNFFRRLPSLSDRIM